ncbi:hypothetical protein HQ585_04230, partial [candidate division KSB1 bacterium]|nr:hypothetical protein [candidate division KSB1 bacterium]
MPKQKRKLIIILGALLVVGFLTTSLVSYFVSLSSLRSQIDTTTLPLTGDNVYSEIQRDLLRPIFISSLMANNSFLRDWILDGEKDVSQMTKYLNEIMVKYNTFTSFFVSEKTHIYYHANGILKKVDPEEPRDAWYFRVREMEADYETNVDPDLANKDAMTIFINYRVFDYDGNYIGATGVGLTINAVNDLMEEYNKKYNCHIYFTDKQGKIMLQYGTFPEETQSIHEIDGLSVIADSLLATNSNILQYTRQGQNVHLNTRFVEALGWHLFVEQTEIKEMGQVNRALLINLLLCVLITSIVVLLARLTMNAYQKINETQQNEILVQTQELLENYQALEMANQKKTAALDKNELLMIEMNHRVKNNLTTLQSLLNLQSSKMHDNESKIAFKESESRVQLISKIHRMLSSKEVDLRKVSVAQYIQDLVADLTLGFRDNESVHVHTEIQEFNLDLNILIPLALILNELITNAFKYSFAGRESGELNISLHGKDQNQIELVVQDDGIGLPEGFDVENLESM